MEEISQRLEIFEFTDKRKLEDEYADFMYENAESKHFKVHKTTYLYKDGKYIMFIEYQF